MFKSSFNGNFNGYNFNPNFKQSNTKKTKHFIICLIISIIVALGAWYFLYPVLNWHSPVFVTNIFILTILVFIVCSIAFVDRVITSKTYSKILKSYFFILFALVILVIVLNVFSSPLFNAKEYASRIQIVETNFDTISEVDFNKTPIIDRYSTEALGDRVMGQMPELVSQFEVSNDYTQISYKDSVYRVTPLEYADFYKYLTNRSEGIPAYILVNSTTGEASLVKLKDLGLDGMKYVPSAMLNENLNRKLQLQYPTEIFGSPSFEIDEDGHPWYVCTTYTYKAMGNKKSVKGVVLFDPITGDSTKYDNILDAPKWIDRVYPESLITQEINNYGSLKDGFLNSIFGQKNVVQTSEGYNYLEKDGDIWIYSGITSVSSDSANLGFVLANLRTHEAIRINSAGADEFSAMNSAEGEVKNYGYYSTFPLLVNVGGRPVYLVALKDNAGLIKMYAMIDATDYQKVVTVSAEEGLPALKKKFVNAIGSNSINLDQLKTKTITIAKVDYFVLDGQTKVYITTNTNEKYKVVMNDANENIVAFLNTDDKIKVEYYEADVNIIQNIEK